MLLQPNASDTMSTSKSNAGGNATSATKTASHRTNPITSSDGTMFSTQLMQLFEDELKDIYWAEKALTKAIPRLIDNSTSKDLIDALESHLGETEEQVVRLEQVFASIGKRAITVKCEAMDGLIKEAESIMADCEAGAMRDAGIISAAQKVEHYEIASYGTLRQFAETLGLQDAADLLEQTLHEERAADEKLSEIAIGTVNAQAATESENSKPNKGKSTTK
jgi:ferritin-like metal-binding protein YciE